MVYFRYEKERVDRLRFLPSISTLLTIGVVEENKSMGTPRVGGPYSLTNHYGEKVTQDTYKGKHTLVSSWWERWLMGDIFRVYEVS